MNLTAPQRRMLDEVQRASENFDGLAPYGRSEHKTIHALVDRGLVKFLAMGECGDGCERAGECPHPVSIYVLTDEGRHIAKHPEGGE